MKKQYVIAVLAVGFLAFGAASALVLADNEQTKPLNGYGEGQPMTQGVAPAIKVQGGDNESNSDTSKLGLGRELEGARSTLTINGNDMVQLNRGKVVSVSGQTLSVSVFGLTLTVTASASTTLAGVADIAHINVGDTVSVKGIIDPASGVIAAMVIRDESQNQQLIDSIRQQIQTLLDQLRKLQQQAGNQ